MKTNLSVLALFTFTSLFAQQEKFTVNEFKAFEEKGKQAYEAKNYSEAQTIFTKLNKQDETNPTYKLYLGLLDINLNEGKNACNLFVSAYQQKNENVKNLIRRYCPEIRKNNLAFLDEVTQQPTLRFNDQTYDMYFFKEDVTKSTDTVFSTYINPVFFKLVEYNYIKSNDKIAKSYKNVIVTFTFIDKEIKILSVKNRKTNQELDQNSIAFFTEIFNKNVEYTSAMFNDKPVNVVNKFSLPISIK